jgi:multicomponent Na+:H+ antiporter subunit G
MTLQALAAGTLLVIGSGFIIAGTVGVLRFGDAHSRLHAVTKADNLGLGLIAAGLAILDASLLTAVKLAVIWLLALLASSTAAYLVANHELRSRRDG